MKELLLILFSIVLVTLLNCQTEHLIVEHNNQTRIDKNNVTDRYIHNESDRNINNELDKNDNNNETEIDDNISSNNKSNDISKDYKQKYDVNDNKKNDKISKDENDIEDDKYLKDKSKKVTNKITNNKSKEKYYDYNYTFNTNKEKDRPININISYPPPYQQSPPNIDNNSNYQYDNDNQLYNTTLIKNLAGTPTDQVQTNYSVLEDNRYDSWDKYYLPGYSYFPPSKWQLPRDNSYYVPKELRDEKCNVCPLISNNGTNNYLSGDMLKK